nr:MAG TPA: hypothetical protein [Caudoviricetes sp.]
MSTTKILTSCDNNVNTILQKCCFFCLQNI